MRMIFGELDGRPSQRGEDFLALCQKAGFDATLSEQILTELWMKFILLATNASIMAADAPADRQVARRSRHAPGVHRCLPGSDRCRPRQGRDAAGRRGRADLDFNSHAPPAMKASMALDLERGNRLELPWLGGKVVELGRQLGVPTPTHSMMYAVLKPLHHGNAGLEAKA